VPITALPALAHASAQHLAEVTLGLEGSAVRFPALDVDLSVPGLVLAFSRTVRGEAGS